MKPSIDSTACFVSTLNVPRSATAKVRLHNSRVEPYAAFTVVTLGKFSASLASL